MFILKVVKPLLLLRMFILPDIFDINYFANNYKKFGRANNNNNNKIRENIIISMPFIDD